LDLNAKSYNFRVTLRKILIMHEMNVSYEEVPLLVLYISVYRIKPGESADFESISSWLAFKEQTTETLRCYPDICMEADGPGGCSILICWSLFRVKEGFQAGELCVLLPV
jgi:hypothetical protein